MTSRWGAAVLVVGLVVAAAGYVWATASPTPDANIGAGLLTLFGLALAAVGGVLLLVGVLLRLRRRGEPGPAGTAR